MARELTAHAIDAAPMDLSSPADAVLITLLTERIGQEPDARKSRMAFDVAAD